MAKSRVLAVPIRPAARNPQPGDDEPVGRDPRLIVWNHRWEYDKAPELFADAVLELAARGVPFRLALLGPRAKEIPEPLARLRRHIGERIVADGRLPSPEYQRVLARSSIAVSTALHEFQGLGMLEAASAGATPLVPDALVYPEQYPAACRYPAGDGAALVQRLTDWLERGPPPAPATKPWTEHSLKPQWLETLQSLTGRLPPASD